MTIKKRTRKIPYWDCGFGHFHKEKKVAIRCEKKNRNRGVAAAERREALVKRNLEIVDHWVQCRNFKRVAVLFKLSPQQVSTIVKRSREYYSYRGIEWAFPLYARVALDLKKLGFNSFESVAMEYKKCYPHEISTYQEFRDAKNHVLNFYADYRWLRFYLKAGNETTPQDIEHRNL